VSTPPAAIGVTLRAGKRLHSEGASVHPSQIAAAEADAAKMGVPTKFDTLGRPIFESFIHQRKYLRTQGMHNKRDIS
jgi:hypothetical protein